jgi:hypothetical protein
MGSVKEAIGLGKEDEASVQRRRGQWGQNPIRLGALGCFDSPLLIPVQER